MGGKSNSGAQSSNDQLVALQQKQAAQATEAGVERNARLAYGKNLITGLFEGTPSGAKTLDLSGVTTANEPQATHIGPSWLNLPTSVTSTVPNTNRASLSNGYSWGALPDNGGATSYGLYDASGNLVNSAGSPEALAQTKVSIGGDPSTTTGGFGPDFYNKYQQSILDYYQPQEDQQYGAARSDLAASLARSGQLNSSTANKNIASLAGQDTLNRAQIQSQADTQTGALRSTVAQGEQAALSQLYSTEDPSVAANTAGNTVASADLAKPLLNPTGALFAPITVGVGNALSGFLNPAAYINPTATGSASTPSLAGGTGKTVGGN